jgi:hypothetical protein
MVVAPEPPPPPPPAPSKWPPLIGLLSVIAFVTLGGFMFSGGPSGSSLAGTVEVGQPIEVEGGVTIQPAAGWEITDEVGDPPGVILSGGNGLLLVGVPGGAGSPQELVELYVSGYLEPQSSQLSVGGSEPLPLPAGPAAVASYVGVFEGVDVPIEGEVIGIIGASGTAVVLDGWAPEGTYGTVRDQVAAMAEAVAIP